jgi:uroporphyrinogen decarboxylase
MAIIESEFLDLTRDLDLAAFWAENEQCLGFTTDKPRCAVSFSPDDHWIFEFMAVPSTIRYYKDKAYRDELHREVNRVTQEYVGRTFFSEDTFEHSPKRIENLFGSEFLYLEASTPWLSHVTEDPNEFARILDRAEQIDMASWALPDPFVAEWEARKQAGRPLPKLGGGSRGPATIMTQVLNPQVAIFWMIDYPELMARFRDILAQKMIELNQVLRAFSGNTEEGWSILDDNSALFNRSLYRTFCVPVLQRVMDVLAPAGARRYQHSDSAMGHLIEEQYALGIREVNYGPDVDAALIRQKMPDAMIHGQMPPFTLRNGSPEEIRDRMVEDFRKAGQSGGMIATTAGSLAAGTGVGRMRWFMQIVQDHCRYD